VQSIYKHEEKYMLSLFKSSMYLTQRLAEVLLFWNGLWKPLFPRIFAPTRPILFAELLFGQVIASQVLAVASETLAV